MFKRSAGSRPEHDRQTVENWASVRFELTEQTRQAVDDYLRATGKKSGEFMFNGRRGPDRSMTARQQKTERHSVLIS
jgi:hypothetical protein